MNSLKPLILSVLIRTLDDKQLPPDNLEKGFVQEMLGHLIEFKIRN